MRTFAFAVEYDPGVDPVMDEFRECPDLYARSLACVATADALWRVDSVTGPTAELDAVADRFADHGHAADCFGAADCADTYRSELLHRDPTYRVVYTAWTRSNDCVSIPHLALEYLGPGVLFATDRHRDRYEWRLLVPNDESLGALYEAIRERCPEGTRVSLRKLADASAWTTTHSVRPTLAYTMYETVEAAVEAGYYETPRRTTLEELAGDLAVPRSTLSYRLRRAEAELAHGLVRADTPDS